MPSTEPADPPTADRASLPAPDDEGVRRVVELLEKRTEQHGKKEEEDLFPDDPFRNGIMGGGEVPRRTAVQTAFLLISHHVFLSCVSSSINMYVQHVVIMPFCFGGRRWCEPPVLPDYCTVQRMTCQRGRQSDAGLIHMPGFLCSFIVFLQSSVYKPKALPPGLALLAANGKVLYGKKNMWRLCHQSALYLVLKLNQCYFAMM